MRSKMGSLARITCRDWCCRALLSRRGQILPPVRRVRAIHRQLDRGADIVPATAEHRQKRVKSMARRSGQVGTIVKEGGWYRVRFRIDIPGQVARKQMSVRICRTSGRGLLTKTQRERRKIEIVTAHGANSEE